MNMSIDCLFAMMLACAYGLLDYKGLLVTNEESFGRRDWDESMQRLMCPEADVSAASVAPRTHHLPLKQQSRASAGLYYQCCWPT